MTTRLELLELLEHAQRDLRAAQARLLEAVRMVAASELPDTQARPLCARCGLRLRGPLALAEHVHLSHGGPLPEHWVRAETLAGFPPGERL